MRGGMDTAIASWVDKWTPFIRKFAGGLGLRQTDEDDWLQVARMVYWEVSDRFDDSRGRSLNSYVLDMVKRRLLDLKRAENTKSRAWMNASVTLRDELTGGDAVVDTVTECLSACAPDSAVILRLLYEGRTAHELRKRLKIPRSMITRAKDEIAARMVMGGSMPELRIYLTERLAELGLPFGDGESDHTLANRILTHNSTRVRRLRVVPVPDEPDATTNERTACEARECRKSAVPGHRFCSLACSEREYQELNKVKARANVAVPLRTNDDLDSSEYRGDASPAGVAALPNPFGEKTSANAVFDLLREGGTRDELVERLEEVVRGSRIKCSSPSERIRRVVTDVRRLGFELLKTTGEKFYLTGRKK